MTDPDCIDDLEALNPAAAAAVRERRQHVAEARTAWSAYQRYSSSAARALEMWKRSNELADDAFRRFETLLDQGNPTL